MLKLRLLGVAMLGFASAGCATIIRGTSQDFVVQADPPDSQVALSSGETCTASPCKFRRPRKEGFSVTVSHEGYETATNDIAHRWSKNGTTTGIVGNAILGGAIGIGVDAATGATQDLTPNPLIVALKKKPEAATPEVAAAAPAAAAPAADQAGS